MSPYFNKDTVRAIVYKYYTEQITMDEVARMEDTIKAKAKEKDND